MSVEHYENFPVASWLCPPAIRPAVVAIYHFARTADDLADEGDAPPEERRAQLRRYRAALTRAAQQQPDPAPEAWPSVFGPLACAMARHRLPPAPLHHLLDAFEQDTHNPQHPDRAALLAYCARSANPVGRLMLHLADVHTPEALAASDAVCTALQLINFWQDPSVDLPRGRSYFCLADLQRHGLDVDHVRSGIDTPATQAMLCELCTWAEQLMRQGAPVALQVPGRLGWELRLVVQGGLRILERIRLMEYRTLSQRPTLSARDLPPLIWRAAWMRRTTPAQATPTRPAP